MIALLNSLVKHLIQLRIVNFISPVNICSSPEKFLVFKYKF